MEPVRMSRLSDGAPVKMMKLVFVNEGIYPYASGVPSAVGGAERQQWLLARALAATGWSVVVSVRGLLEPGKRRMIDGVEFVGIGRGHILLAWYRFLALERPDWWYWRGASHLWGPAVAIAKMARVRTIFAAAFDSDVQPCRALFRRHRWWPLYAWGLSWTNKIFVQHSGQLATLAPHWRAKAYIIPGIVSQTDCVKPHCERTKDVAWVAMLRQPKRPDLLIQIAQSLPQVRFVVCGGPTRHRSPPGYGERMADALRALPNVEYRGQITPDKALQVIADTSLLLSTSDEEGFPNTFLEAWSAGTPVLSLKIDPEQAIRRMGLGVVSGGVEDAITEITALIDSPQRREKMAIGARQYIAQVHSATAVTTLFNRAIRDDH